MTNYVLLALWLQTNLLGDIWRSFQVISTHDSLLMLSICILGTAGVLRLLVPQQKVHIRAGLLMFAIALFLMGVSSVPAALGFPATAKTLHGAGLLCVAFSFVKFGSIILFDLLLRFTPLCPPQVVRDLLVAGGYVGAGMWLLSRYGVTLSSLVATSAVMTGVIVFSLQDSLSNILGGLVLQIDKCFSEGDWVKIDQTSGRISEITWRHVAIETRNWDTVIIPNSTLMKSQVIVTGLRSGQPIQQRRWIYFNVDFRIPPTDVMRVVTDALVTAPVEGCASEPAPNCILMEFKESYCMYAARYWLTDLVRDDPTDSLVRSRIYFALARAGISLSVPAMTNFVKSQDQERKQLHMQREVDRRLATLDLARVELFREMTDEERRKLAERVSLAPFMKGELLTRQGAEAHWLYILTKGSAEVFVSTETGLEKNVAVIHVGDFFGEMSLLTGQPRTASLRALEEAECYRLDRKAFEDILHGRPEIAHYLSELLARRKVEIEAIRHDLDAEAQAKMMQHQQKSIFDSIHKLFGLSAHVKPAK